MSATTAVQCRLWVLQVVQCNHRLHAVFLVDQDLSGQTGDISVIRTAADPAVSSQIQPAAYSAKAVVSPEVEQAAGQFGRVVVQCSERVGNSAKAARKKAYKKRKKEAAAALAAKVAAFEKQQTTKDGANNNNNEEDEEEVGFSYSISYFSWAVSDSDESDQEEDDKVIAVTLPLKNMRL